MSKIGFHCIFFVWGCFPFSFRGFKSLVLEQLTSKGVWVWAGIFCLLSSNKSSVLNTAVYRILPYLLLCVRIASSISHVQAHNIFFPLLCFLQSQMAKPVPVLNAENMLVCFLGKKQYTRSWKIKSQNIYPRLACQKNYSNCRRTIIAICKMYHVIIPLLLFRNKYTVFASL